MGSNLLAPTLPEFATVTAGLYTETSLRKKVYHFDLSASVNGVAASFHRRMWAPRSDPTSPFFQQSLDYIWIMPGPDQSKRCYAFLQTLHSDEYSLWTLWIHYYHLQGH